jgi:Na+/phosphate symporter
VAFKVPTARSESPEIHAMALQSQTTAGWQQQITALKRQILELKDIIDGVLMAPSSALALPEPDKLDDITDYDISRFRSMPHNIT